MIGRPDAGRLPLPAVRFQVTETGFLPIADGVVTGGSGRVVGDQAPIIGVADRPHHQYGRGDPAILLENLTGALPVLTRGIDQALERAFLPTLTKDDAFLNAKQIVPAQPLRANA